MIENSFKFSTTAAIAKSRKSVFSYRRILAFLFITVSFSHAANAVFAQSKPSKAKAFTFKMQDGVKIYGEIYKSRKGKKAPLILLFHQAGGDSRGEYGSYIAPRLVEQGYNVIAIDQRSGGNRFGVANRTAAALNGKEFSYCDVYNDLKETLLYAKSKGFRGKRIAWGSSYSASLIFRLASEYPNELAGIIGFSPAGGEPMSNCKADLYVSQLKIPALALRPASEMELPTVKQQAALFEKQNVPIYVAENGIHGSSMLHPERVTGDVEPHWRKVLEFIKQATGETAK